MIRLTQFSCCGIVGLVLLLSLLATPALALTIAVGGITINDNGPGDMDLSFGTISFSVTPPGFAAAGRLVERFGPDPTVVLDSLILSQSGGAAVVSDTITFNSSVFNPIFPVGLYRAHLDGGYTTVDGGGIIDRADIAFSASVGPPRSEILIGVLDPPGVMGVPVPPSVLFAPPDIATPLSFDANIHFLGVVPFELGMDDRIILPRSASISATVIPEPSILLLVGFGLVLLFLALRHRRVPLA